jgi:hypothetical protein
LFADRHEFSLRIANGRGSLNDAPRLTGWQRSRYAISAKEADALGHPPRVYS